MPVVIANLDVFETRPSAPEPKAAEPPKPGDDPGEAVARHLRSRARQAARVRAH
jgi:hypothetical protein